MDLAPGTKLGRYEIRSKLGQGGMGEVYLAQDTKLDRKVAIKLLTPDIATDKNRMNRFVQEAKAASALNHPNIITIHEIDETSVGQFLATEFIDGETLRERMRRELAQAGPGCRCGRANNKCVIGCTQCRNSSSRHQAGKRHAPSRRNR